jgi:hypothetical protein
MGASKKVKVKSKKVKIGVEFPIVSRSLMMLLSKDKQKVGAVHELPLLFFAMLYLEILAILHYKKLQLP